ncbi:hypothetical protein [Pseudorhodoplanes sp.]|uniref:hypothetical protein n=1 Tax=Pseudorhodoplanes sp. TaxID=1934341 RepID=UPI002B9C3AB9|nr:hypothetical protein [Pseudorhodoplanes sp.]HWV39998.1 hypothetical protein [Pseudorhodoplanes sp.]
MSMRGDLMRGYLGRSLLLAGGLAFGTWSLATGFHALAAENGKPIRAAQVNPTSPALPPTVDRPPAPATAQECDALCVRRNADVAAQACVPLIEARAPLDYDWLSRPFGGMFTQAEQPGADGIIRYRGDGIRVLTAQNQWLRHAYQCSYDPVKRQIVAVDLRPGRLVPPADVAKFITDVLKQQPGAQVTTRQAGQQQTAARTTAQPASKAATKPKRPVYGEPSPIFISQARLKTGQIDSVTSIAQSSRRRSDRSP